MRLGVIAAVLVFFLFLIVVSANANIIWQTSFENPPYEEDENLYGYEDWTTSAPQGNIRVRTDASPYHENQHIRFRRNSGDMWAARTINTSGFKDVFFSYARKIDDIEDIDPDEFKASWRPNVGADWITEETVRCPDSGPGEDKCFFPYDFKTWGPLESSANNNPDFTIVFWFTVDYSNDLLFIDSVRIEGTPCEQDGTSCSEASECCGDYCCDDGFSSFCSSTECCALELEPCSVDSDCCDNECDGSEFYCITCNGVFQQNPFTTCEYDCGAAPECDDDFSGTESDLVPGLCCMGDCTSDDSIETCNCSSTGTCGSGYCEDENTCYYHVSCGLLGWETPDVPCDSSDYCSGPCPGPTCMWSERDCDHNDGCVEGIQHELDSGQSYCDGCLGSGNWSSVYSCCKGDDTSDDCTVDSNCEDSCGETILVVDRACTSNCECNTGTSYVCDASNYCDTRNCGETFGTYYCWDNGGWKWQELPPDEGCGPDTTPPSCIPQPANNTTPYVGDAVFFDTPCSDPSGLGDFIFSWTGGGNCDTWENGSQLPFNGNAASATRIIPINCESLSIQYKFYVSDSLGNWDELTEEGITVQTSGGPPVVTITSPEENSNYSANQVSVEYTGDSSANTYYAIDAGWQEYSGSSPLAFIDLSEGSQLLKIKQNNSYGESEDNVTVFVDTIRPSVSISSPSEDGSFDEDWVVVEFLTTSTDVIRFEYSYGGSWGDTEITGITSGTTYSYNFTNVQEGSNTLYVRAVDALGEGTPDNVNVTITVETYEAPSVTIHYPEDSRVYETVERLEFSVTDNVASSYDCDYSIDGDSWRSTTASKDDIKTVSISVDEGDHYVRVRCDNGHKTTDPPERQDFTVAEIERNKPPELKITWPENTTYQQKIESLKFIATDDKTISCQYSIDEKEWQTATVKNNTETEIQENIETKDWHSFQVKCTDGQTEIIQRVNFYVNTTEFFEINGTQNPLNQTIEPNQTEELPPEDYWVVTDPKSTIDRISSTLRDASSRLGLSFPILLFILFLIIVIIIITVIVYPRTRKKKDVQKEVHENKEEACAELKNKKVAMTHKLTELKKAKKGRSKEYRELKKQLEETQNKLLKNDVYLVELYKKSKTVLDQYYSGTKTHELKKQLKKEGYTDKELEIIKKIFTTEKIKRIGQQKDI